MDEEKKFKTQEEITEALETIKSIEMMGFFMEDAEVKLKFAKGIFHCMNLLRDMHDQLVERLPDQVIAQERARGRAQGTSKIEPRLAPDTTPVGQA